MSEPELESGSRAGALTHHALCLLQITYKRRSKCFLISCCVPVSVLWATAAVLKVCEADLSLGGMRYLCGPGRWPHGDITMLCPLKPTNQLESGFCPFLTVWPWVSVSAPLSLSVLL